MSSPVAPAPTASAKTTAGKLIAKDEGRRFTAPARQNRELPKGARQRERIGQRNAEDEQAVLGRPVARSLRVMQGAVA